MAKGTRRVKDKGIHITVWAFVALAVVFLGMVVMFIAAGRSTDLRQFAAARKKAASRNTATGGCNDANCQNVKNGSFWQITNCDSPDPNGDQQLCNWDGRVGQCGGKEYCCPSKGGQWTTTMTACATPTPTPTPTPDPTDTPTPTPSPTPTATPTPRPTYYIEPTDTPMPTDIPTATPTISLSAACNKSCATNVDCPGGLTCASTLLGLSSCRNPYCADKVSCLCDEGPLGQLLVTPTGADSQLGGSRQINLTVSSFTNDKGQTNATPVFTGITEPGAAVTVSIFPDGAGGTVVADSTGKWTWNQSKPLTAGRKNLLVVAKKDNGQGQVAQAFTVVAGRAAPSSSLLIILLIVGLLVGGYLYMRSKS